MSIADTQRTKDLERKLESLENRVLMMEMQKRPVEAVSNVVIPSPVSKRETISLRGRAA